MILSKEVNCNEDNIDEKDGKRMWGIFMYVLRIIKKELIPFEDESVR